jgi:hypothetical protein
MASLETVIIGETYSVSASRSTVSARLLYRNLYRNRREYRAFPNFLDGDFWMELAHMGHG